MHEQEEAQALQEESATDQRQQHPSWDPFSVSGRTFDELMHPEPYAP